MIEHFWHRLPGPIWFNANEIYREQVMRAGNGAVFVELGAWKGRSAAFMGVEIANSGRDIEFYAVDTWLGSAGESAHKTDPDVQESTLYEAFLENVEPVRDWVKPLRELSTEAATHFGDGSVDFVFVDAGHTYRDVTNDLVAWWPKVRPGGVIAADDWSFRDPSDGQRSVRRAVRRYFNRPDRFYAIELWKGTTHPEWTQWLVRKDGGFTMNLVMKTRSIIAAAR
jgi:SAM-dependent methyltransferase